MFKVTKPGIDILQSCSVLTFHWVRDVEFKCVIAVWASVFALKSTHGQALVSCINAIAVFGNQGPAFTFLTFNLQRLKHKISICFFLNI